MRRAASGHCATWSSSGTTFEWRKNRSSCDSRRRPRLPAIDCRRSGSISSGCLLNEPARAPRDFVGSRTVQSPPAACRSYRLEVEQRVTVAASIDHTERFQVSPLSAFIPQSIVALAGARYCRAVRFLRGKSHLAHRRPLARVLAALQCRPIGLNGPGACASGWPTGSAARPR